MVRRYEGIDDRAHATEGQRSFLFFSCFSLEDARWLAVAAGERKARTKERMHPSSVIHCPGCTPYVFPCRGASRIIQIIASEMIISDDHATVDLAALKWHARVQRYLHLILDSIKGTYFMLYPKVFRNSRLPDERAIARCRPCERLSARTN